MSPEIFLSYANIKDLDGTVTAFHAALDQRIKENFNTNAKVFMDKSGIQAGDLWENNLKANLANSTAILILLSPAWLNSSWCLEEYKSFKSTHVSDANRGIIIPLLWTDTELRNAQTDESKAILIELKAIQVIDWRSMKNDRGYKDSEKLRLAIEQLASDITNKIWEISN